MNKDKDSAQSAQPPDVFVTGRPRWRVSLVWIVPVLAIGLAAGLAVHAILARGPQITIRFSSAQGLETNKTKIRYKDVDIGTVKSIALSRDRRSVEVTVAMDKQAEPLLVVGSRFWVVRPRIGAGGISGLSTVLSGPYIAVDPATSHEPCRTFVGLAAPPLVVSGMRGRQFVLTADNLGSLDVGAPV